MAYTKRRFVRRTGGRRRPCKKLNKCQVREVKSLIGRRVETKYIDCLNQVLTGIQNNGTIFSISNPSQGAGQAQRVGDSITIKKIVIRYSCVGYDPTNLMRVIVFKWLNDNAVSSPATGYIMDNGWLGQDTAPLADYNFNNIAGHDFVVCYDKLHTLSNNAAGAAPGSTVRAGKIVLTGKKLHKPKIEYNAGLTTGEGMYYLLVISDSGVAGHPKFNAAGRTTYIDA